MCRASGRGPFDELRRVMASVEQFLTCRLKLKVNTAKSVGSAPRGAQIPRLQRHQRSRAAASDCAAGAGPVYQPGASVDAAHGWRESATSHRQAVGLSDGLARLFRVLSDARTAAQFGGMRFALPCLGAMAQGQATLHRAAPIRDRALARCHYHSGGAPARPLAS